MIFSWVNKIIGSYSVVDIQNNIFFMVCQRCCTANKRRLFQFMQEEINHPSEDIINITKHLNFFNTIIKFAVLFMIITFLVQGGVTLFLIEFGFILLMFMLPYQYYIDGKIYNISTAWINKLL